MKRLLYLLSILGAITLVVGIGWFLRYRADAPSEEEAPPATGALPDISLPPAGAPPPAEETPPTARPAVLEGTGGFGVIAPNLALNYFVYNDNSVVLIQPDGQIIRVVKGESSVLSSTGVANAESFSFSHNGKKVLASFGGAASPQHSIFDVESKSWRPLPEGIIAAAWAPESEDVVYLDASSGSGALASFDAAGEFTEPKTLTELNLADANLYWTKPDTVIAENRGTAASAGSVILIDVNSEQVFFLASGFGVASAWNGSENLGLVFSSQRGGREGRLTLFDDSGNALANLAFLTLPEKCAASSEENRNGNATGTAAKHLYCAVPENKLFSLASLPDDYYQEAVKTNDRFFKINVGDGEVEEVQRPAGVVIDAWMPKIANGKLFFINRHDKRLYAIQLAE